MIDDLVDLIVPHWSDGAAPTPALGGQGSAVEYGQGTVVEWNSETAENIIRYKGEPLENLPMINSADVLVTQPGDQVAIMSWAPAGGSGAIWIMGRLIVPGSDAAERSIDFMRAALARNVAAEILASRIHTAEVSGTITVTSTANVPNGGPILPDIEISPTGMAVVLTGVGIDLSANGSGNGGEVVVAVDGADSATTFGRSAFLGSVDSVSFQHNATGVFVLSGLTEGLHTFEMWYSVLAGSTEARFYDRQLIVIAL